VLASFNPSPQAVLAQEGVTGSGDFDLQGPEPFTAPIEQRTPWREAAGRLHVAAQDDYLRGNFSAARRRWELVYARYDRPQTDLAVGDLPPGDPYSLHSRILWNIGVCYEREGNLAMALFSFVRSEAWLDTSGDQTSDDRRQLRARVRALRETIERQGVALPGGIEKFVNSDDRSRRDYIRALREARMSYLARGGTEVGPNARAAIQIFDLSEPWLWLARTADERRRCPEALEAYRTYQQRLADEGGDRDVAVERRIGELEDQCGERRGPTSVPGGDVAERGTVTPTGSRRGEVATPTPGPSDAAPPDSGQDGRPTPGAADQQRPDERDVESTPQPDDARDSAKETPKALSIEIGYVFRRIKQTGRYEIDLRQRLREDRELTMAGNIGGFIRGRADQTRHLLEVNLDDPFFEDRTVEILLDGQDYQDFENYVNAVEVQLRREHAGGVPTEGSVVFGKEQFADDGNRLTWTYPRLGDPPEAWLGYSYKVNWSFHGGARAEGDWRANDESVLTLSSPVRYRTLRVTFDDDDLRRNGVRAVVVQFRHRLLGKTVTREVLVDYQRGDPLSTSYRYLAPPNDDRYEVRAIWVTEDGRETTQDWHTREGAYVLLKVPS
jgi:hypothetical protein